MQPERREPLVPWEPSELPGPQERREQQDGQEQEWAWWEPCAVPWAEPGLPEPQVQQDAGAWEPSGHQEQQDAGAWEPSG